MSHTGPPDGELPYEDPFAESLGTDVVPAEMPEGWGQLTKDFLVFEGKLLLDGFIDLVMTTLAAVAYVFDLITGDRSGRRFYGLLRSGRRLEHWMRLYRPSSRAGPPKDRLADAGLTSADHLIAKIEGMVREQELPEAYRERLRNLATKARGGTASGPGGRDHADDSAPPRPGA